MAPAGGSGYRRIRTCIGEFVCSVVTYQRQSGHAAVLADTTSVPTLFLPYGAAIGPDGNLYVVAGAICSAQGQGPPGCTRGNVTGGRLLKINLPHDEDDKDR